MATLDPKRLKWTEEEEEGLDEIANTLSLSHSWATKTLEDSCRLIFSPNAGTRFALHRYNPSSGTRKYYYKRKNICTEKNQNLHFYKACPQVFHS